jgi:predicted RNase H-like nuclease (RuvC/YqgF family)
MASNSPSTTQYAQDIPLSLAERRQRNKAASAKYRAKKHAVTAQMSNRIDALTASNVRLQRELDDAQRENSKLKDRCEDLRRQLGGKHHGMPDSPQDGKKRKGLEGVRTTSTSAPPNLPSRSKSIKSKSKK